MSKMFIFPFDIWTLNFIWPASALRNPALQEDQGHNINDISLPGSVALWAGSFKFELHLIFWL